MESKCVEETHNILRIFYILHFSKLHQILRLQEITHWNPIQNLKTIKGKVVIISCFKEWENQGNLLYQISLQMTIFQTLPQITNSWGKPFLQGSWATPCTSSPIAFFILAATLHVSSDSDCICLPLKPQLLSPMELAICQVFSKHFVNIKSPHHHNNPVN